MQGQKSLPTNIFSVGSLIMIIFSLTTYSTGYANIVIADTAADPSLNKAPVVLGVDTLFYIKTAIESFSAQDRALIATNHLKEILENVSDSSNFTTSLRKNDFGIAIINGTHLIATVTDSDAVEAGISQDSLALKWAGLITDNLAQRSQHLSLKLLILSSALSLLGTAIMIIMLRLVRWVYRKVEITSITDRASSFSMLKIGTYELLPAPRIEALVAALLKGLYWGAISIIIYFYLYFVLSQFPWTEDLANSLLSHILNPLISIGSALLNYLPNLFFLAMVVLVLRIVLKFTREVFNQMALGHIVIPGFYNEWAEPTYKIVRFLILAFALVVAFPYLPGSQSPAFKGISIFVGVLFSLGSTSAIANMVAGIVLTYMRPFKLGDRVKVADTTGDVVEKTLLSTRIRTVKNVEITIPNATLLSNHIENFSSAAGLGIILHTSVTIGYDVPWRTVHELLISAANATERIVNFPTPFVLQTSLDDYYVSYQLNATTHEPNKSSMIYSELHQNIQDKFFEAGVEIMSSHYYALRDGNSAAIPVDKLPKDYRSGKFAVSLSKEDKTEGKS